ncbi:hypothetical protein [Streptomyces javensis]|uniref:Uncharacterized protein n=1 Tax=Streptomyces javensis TaxID=114698 RepID=A0ABN1WRK6_9ACTN
MPLTHPARWSYAAEVADREAVVRALLTVASGAFVLLGAATLVHGGRRLRPRAGRHRTIGEPIAADAREI